MKQFWIERSSREKTLISVAGILAGITLFYYLIISPIGGWRASAASEKLRAENTYSMVVEAVSRGAPAGSRTAALDSASVQNRLIQTARTNAITLNYVNRRPDDNVEVTVDVIDATTLFNWLRQLQTVDGVNLVSADISRAQGAPGLVQGQFVFGGGG